MWSSSFYLFYSLYTIIFFLAKSIQPSQSIFIMPNQEYNDFFRAKSILIVAKPSHNTIIVVVRQSRRVLLLFPSYYSINILPALLNNHYSCAGGVIDKKNVKYRAPNNKYLFPTRISFDRPCKILKFLSGLGTSKPLSDKEPWLQKH